MEKQSQFHLFRERRFLPFFLTQFFGAFNDNLFKNALLVIVVSGVVAASSSANFLTNLAAGLFILPFFLFSATAGQLADKYDKAMLIRRIKIAEILIMLVACVSLYTANLWLMMCVLFALGIQSAFFGPLKYSIIPQHLEPEELLAGNAQVEMGTFVSILLGTMIGGSVVTFEQGKFIIGALIIFIALLGWFSSRYIPEAAAAAPDIGIKLNPIVETWHNISFARQSQVVFYSMLGVAWFWLFGASYLTQVPNYAVSVLNGHPRLIVVLLSAFIIGIASGSLLCDRLSGHKVEPGLIPFGAFGLSLFGIDLYFSSINYIGPDTVAPLQFIFSLSGFHILLDLLLIGMFGGFYIVPLYAVIQSRTSLEKRARIISANNILNSLFMVISSILGILFLSVAGLAIPDFLLAIALMNIAVASFIFWQIPEFAMRFLIWLLSHTLYRVDHYGLEHIPEKGAAIIVCNHVSFVDAPIMAGAVRRPIRFIMHKSIYDIPVLNFIFRTGKTIPICSPKEDPAAYQQAMDHITEGLDSGELLCIFPEGKLTHNGEIDTFKPGIERILQRNPVPVIPMALRGLWGSFFSHSGAGTFKTPFWRFWSHVDVIADFPLPAEGVTAGTLQTKVQTLRGDKK